MLHLVVHLKEEQEACCHEEGLGYVVWEPLMSVHSVPIYPVYVEIFHRICENVNQLEVQKKSHYDSN